MLKHFQNKLFSELFGEPIDQLKPKTPNPNPNYRPPCHYRPTCRGSNIPEQPNVPPMPKATIQRVGFGDKDDSTITLPKGVSIHRVSDGWEIEFKKEELTILLSDIK